LSDYRHSAQFRPITELANLQSLEAFRAEQLMENPNKTEIEIERDIRITIDSQQLEIYNKTQAETLKRAPFEDQIKRPYFSCH